MAKKPSKKSLKNLEKRVKFKPGNKANATGYPNNLPKEIKDKRKLTKQTVITAVEKYSHMTLKDLTERWEKRYENDLKTLDATILNIFRQAAETGDTGRLEFLLNRTIGKVKLEVEVTKVPQESLVEWLERRRKENPIVIEGGDERGNNS